VAIVPDFWFSSNSWCYPQTSRKGNRAVAPREIAQEDWLNYPAKSRGKFGSYIALKIYTHSCLKLHHIKLVLVQYRLI
jgi:hypothetical protein